MMNVIKNLNLLRLDSQELGHLTSSSWQSSDLKKDNSSALFLCHKTALLEKKIIHPHSVPSKISSLSLS
jgi:hypothetical protein